MWGCACVRVCVCLGSGKVPDKTKQEITWDHVSETKLKVNAIILSSFEYIKCSHCILHTSRTYLDLRLLKRKYSFSFVCNTILLNLLLPGLFILNLVCRDPVLRTDVLERVKSVFPTVLSRKIAEEINEVLLCSREEKNAAHILPSSSQAAKNFQSMLSCDRTEPKRRPLIDIAEMIKDLKLE